MTPQQKYAKSDKGKKWRAKYRKTSINRALQRRHGKVNSKKRYHNNKESARNYSLKKRYGIDLEQYNVLLEQQNFSCAICGAHQDQCARRLAVDHCHTTNQIRGLLCKACNTGLGSFQDSPEILEKAIRYILKCV